MIQFQLNLESWIGRTEGAIYEIKTFRYYDGSWWSIISVDGLDQPNARGPFYSPRDAKENAERYIGNGLP